VAALRSRGMASIGSRFIVAKTCSAYVLFSEDCARRSVSRVLSPPEGGRWPFVWDVHRRTPRATYPGDGPETCLRAEARVPPLFGLAPGVVYPATAVTDGAVRSYRTLSPLPSFAEASKGGLLSVALSLGSPPPGVTRHRVSVEPGLSSPRQVSPLRKAAIRPSGGRNLAGGTAKVKT
jgi:hypothetical protein